MTRPLCIIDTETGGFEKTVHPIIQIAIVVIDRDAIGLPEIDHFEVKLEFNELECTSEALARNIYGREPELWPMHAIDKGTALRQCCDFLDRFRIVRRLSKTSGKEYLLASGAGHNVEFDKGFLFHLAREFDVFLPLYYNAIDTLQLAMIVDEATGHHEPTDRYGLDDLCVRYHIPVEEPGAHDALADARRTAALYRKLITKL